MEIQGPGPGSAVLGPALAVSLALDLAAATPFTHHKVIKVHGERLAVGWPAGNWPAAGKPGLASGLGAQRQVGLGTVSGPSV